MLTEKKIVTLSVHDLEMDLHGLQLLKGVLLYYVKFQVFYPAVNIQIESLAFVGLICINLTIVVIDRT